MKKFVLIVLMMSFGMLGANAMTMVHYNNAGVPVSYSRGMSAPRQMPFPTQRMSTSSLIPPTRISRVSMPSRPSRPSRPYASRYYSGCSRGYGYRMSNNYMEPVRSAAETINTISRFDKNYSVNIPQKVRTVNGVTYYN